MTLKGQKKGLIFCIILLNILLLQINQVNTRTDDNPPREEFNALGLIVKVYFDPEPGVLLQGVSKIKGIITTTGIFTGLYLHVEVRSHGSFRGDDTSMLELGGPDYFIFQENQTHKKEITIRTPTSGSFRAGMIIDFDWGESFRETDSKPVKVEGEYRRSSSVGNTIFSVEFILFLIVIGFVFLTLFFIGKILIHSSKKDTKSVYYESLDNSYDEITRISRLRKTNVQDKLDLKKLRQERPLGLLGLINSRKGVIFSDRKVVENQLKEIDNLENNLESLNVKVKKNKLYSFITDNFRKACKNRNNYADEDEVRVETLRTVYYMGRIEFLSELLDKENLLCGFRICHNYNLNSGNSNKTRESVNRLGEEAEVNSCLEEIQKYFNTLNESKFRDFNEILKKRDGLVKKASELQEEKNEIETLLRNTLKLIDYRNKCIKQKNKTKMVIKKLSNGSRGQNRLQRIQVAYDQLEEEISFSDALLLLSS